MTRIFGALADHFKATPILLMVLFLNLLIGAGFWFALNSANEAANRQAELLEKCLLRR
jgi:F0F1-type ATP synthase assembly protein I